MNGNLPLLTCKIILHINLNDSSRHYPWYNRAKQNVVLEIQREKNVSSHVNEEADRKELIIGESSNSGLKAFSWGSWCQGAPP